MTPEVTTLIDRYAEYLRAERKSPRTIANYRCAVKGFARFLGDRCITTATCADIVAYQAQVAAKGKSDSSVRVATYALRGLFHKILQREDWNFARLPKPRKSVRLPEILSQKEIEAIMESAPSLKYRAAFMLCYGSGLRTEEVVHLEPHHVDGTRRVLLVRRGKGDKDRLVVLPERLLLTLRECWRKYHPKKYLIRANIRGSPSPQPASSERSAPRASALESGRR